jgi:formate-dependent nitrite reductase membrane component NrfD
MEPGLLKSAEWPLLIDVYFFLGGVAGGAFVIATVAYLLDGQRYRDVVRAGYYIALLAIIPCPILLIVDLGLPTRFLHMLMVPKPSPAIGMDAVTVGPFHLKPFSPMNVGAWALLVFSACAFVAALDTFLGQRGGRSVPGLRLAAGLVGSVFGFFLAAYPGVLLGATARPLFVNGTWLGALFLAIGASTGGAAIALVLSLGGGGSREGLARLMRVTSFAVVLQLVFLALFILTVRSSGSAGIGRALAVLLSGPYSVPFWLGAVVVGIVAPLALQFSGAMKRPGVALAALTSVLILVGGFLTKWVIIAAGQAGGT